jgi:hypothetical protein
VGQQSGAIGNNSDLSALPRFPLSGIYANRNTIDQKLLSLPFPLQQATLLFEPAGTGGSNTPDSAGGNSPAPVLELTLSETLAAPIQCFMGSGEHLLTQNHSAVITVQTKSLLPAGRHRYNCTAASKQAGRYYWYSQQWLQP